MNVVVYPFVCLPEIFRESTAYREEIFLESEEQYNDDILPSVPSTPSYTFTDNKRDNLLNTLSANYIPSYLNSEVNEEVTPSTVIRSITVKPILPPVIDRSSTNFPSRFQRHVPKIRRNDIRK